MRDIDKLVAMSIFILEPLTLVNLEIRNNHGDIKGLTAQGCHENGLGGGGEEARALQPSAFSLKYI